jgi:hypothetical protein
MKDVRMFYNCKHCFTSKSQRPMGEWLELHILALCKSQNDRNNAAMAELRRHQMLSSNKFVGKPSLLGASLCWSCYAFLYGMSYYTLNRKKHDILEGQKDWNHRGKGQSSRLDVKQKAVIKFITELQENFGETIPDKTKIELPPDTKANLYLDFSITQKSKNCGGCAYDYFTTIWRKNFPDLILPKHPRWVNSSWVNVTFFVIFR